MQFLKLIADFFIGLLGGGLGKQAIGALLQAQKQQLDAKNEAQRLAADMAVSFWEEQVSLLTVSAKEGTKRQEFKMNHKVFWFILGAAMLPGLSTFLLITIYNVFWHQAGIWPQYWNIAAFPPPYDLFLTMSMEWIFDPMKMALNTGIAAVGGYAAGTRK